VAVHLPGVLRKDRPGGSRALGELIEEYGEEIYLDLKEYWDFDLVSFIAGEVFSSIRVISSLIRNLPEGSRFRAVTAVDYPEASEDRPESDPRAEAIADRRSWTLDRRLVAMEINAINLNTAATGQWKGSPPDFPTVGPAEWQSPADKRGSKTGPEPAYTDNFDFFKKMGWPSG
jgi:hypothetical protein